MKINKILSIALISGAALMITGCAPDVRDIKISQLTPAQEEQVMAKLTKEEQSLIVAYQIRTTIGDMSTMFDDFSNAITGQKPTKEQVEKRKNLEDLTINEAIKAQREFEKQ